MQVFSGSTIPVNKVKVKSAAFAGSIALLQLVMGRAPVGPASA